MWERPRPRLEKLIRTDLTRRRAARVSNFLLLAVAAACIRTAPDPSVSYWVTSDSSLYSPEARFRVTPRVQPGELRVRLDSGSLSVPGDQALDADFAEARKPVLKWFGFGIAAAVLSHPCRSTARFAPSNLNWKICSVKFRISWSGPGADSGELPDCACAPGSCGRRRRETPSR